MSDEKPTTAARQEPAPRGRPVASLIVTVAVAAIAGASIWFLLQPQPLLVQGEADATRIDVAARVDGRVGERPVDRGDRVEAGAVLVRIDNPELVAKLAEARAAKAVAEADLARILVGTRAETIAERKAALAAAEADLQLAQATYDRTKILTAKDFASVQKLDEATNALDVAKRARERARFAHEEAVAGFTKEQREVARAAVAKGEATVATLTAQVGELVVTAPARTEVYQVGVEPGEYVSPGAALMSLVDLGDVWLRFDLREDLMRGLKVGDRFSARLPALGDRPVVIAVRTIATRGEYAGWRATRATGDFDLRTFEVRAYPVEPVAGLRPGMSAYVDWSATR